MFSRRSFLSASGAALVVSFSGGGSMAAVEPNEPDHIILGCQDLDDGIAYLEKFSGYRAEFAGVHAGRGTRNALLKLGYHSYLEVLAPDPRQPKLTWHKELTELSDPLLVGWARAVKDIDRYAASLRAKGTACIGPTPGSRSRPNGDLLNWKTLMLEDDKAGILPFYIEWATDSPHPSTDAPGACLLERMHHSGQVLQTPPPGPD
jgi:Glyoxalase-like domain